jgi:hypothetical protein
MSFRPPRRIVSESQFIEAADAEMIRRGEQYDNRV